MKEIIIKDYFNMIYDDCHRLVAIQSIGDERKLINAIRNQNDELQRLKQEIKALYEEKNCLHKIIDRLLENSGYSKDIASAEDFEDVYEDMQIKRNELIELKQENEELKYEIDRQKETIIYLNNSDVLHKILLQYKTALEEIKEIAEREYDKSIIEKDFHESDACIWVIIRKINEMLNKGAEE